MDRPLKPVSPASPPPGLSAEARRLWTVYHDAWELDEHADLVLRLALEAHDRMRGAQAEIKRRGWGPGAKGGTNPYTVERDARRDVAKLLKTIGLSLDVVPTGGNGARGRRS